MLASAQASDPQFPDGMSVKLTSFAYFGTVQSPDGPIRVAYRTAVIAGMPAPRGLQELMYFDRDGRWLGNEKPGAEPLWASGSLLMLRRGIPLEAQPVPEDLAYGHVIDFSKGFASREVKELPFHGLLGAEEVPANKDIPNPEGIRR